GRSIGLQLLSTTRQALGSLDRVEAVLKVLGMVNAVPEFKDHPKVINGCSDLFVEVLGEAGRHARSAVGMGSLPNQISVEIEAILSLKSLRFARGGGAHFTQRRESFIHTIHTPCVREQVFGRCLDRVWA